MFLGLRMHRLLDILSIDDGVDRPEPLDEPDPDHLPIYRPR
jgi:hypothetical protein